MEENKYVVVDLSVVVPVVKQSGIEKNFLKISCYCMGAAIIVGCSTFAYIIGYIKTVSSSEENKGINDGNQGINNENQDNQISVSGDNSTITTEDDYY